MNSTKKGALPILFLTIFIDLLGFGIVFPILPNYARDINIPESLIGTLVGAFALVQFFATPFWGSLSDRIGRRPVLLTSTLITSVAYLVFGFANSFAILIISRILSGFGSGNISAAQAYIADITPPEKRTKRMGFLGAAFGLGFIFGPPLGGLIKTNLGIEYVGFITAGLCFTNFILAYFILPEPDVERNKQRKLEILPFIPIFNAFKKKGINMVLVLSAIYTMAFFMFNITAIMIWRDKYTFNDEQIGYIFTVIGVCTVITQAFLVGWFIRRFNEITLFVSGNLIVGACLFAFTFVPKGYFFMELIMLGLLAVANGMVRPTSLSILSKLTNKLEQGSMMGVFQSVGSVAMGVGPMIAAPLYGLGWYLPYYLGSGLLLFNLLIINNLRSFMRREKSKTAVEVEAN